jgi:hypothetical protein
LATIGLVGAYFWVASIKKKVFGIKPKFIKILLFVVFFLLFILNFSYYLNQYFVQLNYYDASEWQYGYAQVMPVVQKLENSYSRIIISDKAPMDKSYMFTLFYLRYSPQKYQNFGEESGGFAVHQKFDKFEFRPIDWDKDSKLHNVLLVGLPSEFPTGVNAKKIIYFPNGKPAMVMVARD